MSYRAISYEDWQEVDKEKLYQYIKKRLAADNRKQDGNCSFDDMSLLGPTKEELNQEAECNARYGFGIPSKVAIGGHWVDPITGSMTPASTEEETQRNKYNGKIGEFDYSFVRLERTGTWYFAVSNDGTGRIKGTISDYVNEAGVMVYGDWAYLDVDLLVKHSIKREAKRLGIIKEE